MTFEVKFKNIPDITRENFLTACGKYDDFVSKYDFDTRRNHELAKCKGNRVSNGLGELVYEFESEAHYNWFVVRWS
jgi:hypothetical protein